MQQRAALEDGRGHAAPRPQKPVPRVNSWSMASAVLPALAVSCDIGQAVRDGDADLGAGGVQVGLGLQHIRALRHQLRRQADRQILRQLQTRQVEFFAPAPGSEAAGQHRQQIAQLGRLLDQRRQGGATCASCDFLRGDIEPAGIAFVELVLQDIDRCWC